MPASHPSPANPGPPSVAKPHPGAATRHSNVCCSFPHLHPSKVTQPPAPTTTRNEPKANATTKPSSPSPDARSEEHTSELQSRGHLVCRLLLEKKKKETKHRYTSQRSL